MTLHELATRVEQAEGANYALDVEISDAIWRMKWGKRRPKDIKVQPYTASLDAAMMLVPEGCGFAIMGNGAKVGRHIGASSTLALALTAAALADVVEDDSAAEPVVELVPAEGFETSAEETPPMPPDAEGYELALLRFFRDLYENERLKILVELDAIPAESNERINQGLERRLFDWLAREGRLPDLILMIDRLIADQRQKADSMRETFEDIATERKEQGCLAKEIGSVRLATQRKEARTR